MFILYVYHMIVLLWKCLPVPPSRFRRWAVFLLTANLQELQGPIIPD